MQQAELWDCLFLTLPEIEELLAFVRDLTAHPFVFAMFVFAAHTGARRSELLRSQLIISFRGRDANDPRKEEGPIQGFDVPFRADDAQTEARDVRMVRGAPRRPAHHFPGGDLPLTVQPAGQHFRWVVEGSKWVKLHGWHVFRHSFASNWPPKESTSGSSTLGWGTRPKKCVGATATCSRTSSRWRSTKFSAGWLEAG